MQQRLFMLLVGCKPAGRHTEQHDVFFGIGTSVKELLPQLEQFWPDCGKMHIDAWREVRIVDGFQVIIVPRLPGDIINGHKLFFMNLGGYKPNEFEEFHYKMLVVGTDKAGAVEKAKQTAFYKHTGFEGANSHIDDRYGVDVDDIYEISDILPASIKAKFSITIEPSALNTNDDMHLGYFKLSSFE